MHINCYLCSTGNVNNCMFSKLRIRKKKTNRPTRMNTGTVNNVNLQIAVIHAHAGKRMLTANSPLHTYSTVEVETCCVGQSMYPSCSDASELPRALVVQRARLRWMLREHEQQVPAEVPLDAAANVSSLLGCRCCRRPEAQSVTESEISVINYLPIYILQLTANSYGGI